MVARRAGWRTGLRMGLRMEIPVTQTKLKSEEEKGANASGQPEAGASGGGFPFRGGMRPGGRCRWRRGRLGRLPFFQKR